MDYLESQIQDIKAKIEINEKLLADPDLASLASEEINALKVQLSALESAANLNNLPAAPSRSLCEGGATIEIRAAAGGDEAQIFADDLTRMYLRFAQSQGFKTELIDANILRINIAKNNPWGHGAYETFSVESGVHRGQSGPATESAGRIHTSTATAAVLPALPSQAV